MTRYPQPPFHHPPPATRSSLDALNRRFLDRLAQALEDPDLTPAQQELASIGGEAPSDRRAAGRQDASREKGGIQ